jgi:hypothetical protein
MTRILSLLLLLVLAAPAAAQTNTIVYTLDNVWLDPDISHSWGGTPKQMTGQFEWTYDVGDFENGTGEMLWVNIPWFGSNLAEMIITIETGSMEFSLNGNWHNRGLDVNLKYVNSFTETSAAIIDTQLSSFDIEAGGIYKGHVVSGRVMPDPGLLLNLSGSCPDALVVDVSGATANNQVALLYSFGMGSFTIPNGYPCAGTVLGLNNTVALGTTLASDASGQLTYSFNVPPGACGAVYLQALDLTTCETSTVAFIQ